MMMSLLIEEAARDARYAFRLMRRTPAFTAAAVLTFAVAIAVNTAVFSVVDAVLLRPLPYAAPDRLAIVTRGDPGATATDNSQNGRTWEAIRDHASSINGGIDAAVFSTWTTGVNIVAANDDGSPVARHVRQQRVGAGFFEVLGVRPLLGREFERVEDRPGGPAVTILSAPLWRSVLRANPGAVGRTITLRGETFTVVGVMPDSFESGQRADLWTPLRPRREGEGEGENYAIVARLRPGISWPQAIADVAHLGRQLSDTRDPRAPAFTLSLEPLQAGMTKDLRRPLVLLWAAVVTVLIVACVNLAGLLLARGSARSREIATRIALGGDRARVARQVIVESLVLASVGGLLGVALGYGALEGLKALAEDAFAIWQPVTLDRRAVAAAIVMSMAASLLLGAGPALQASRLDPQVGLAADGARTIAGPRRRWPRQAIVVVQVALGIVLLVVAGLLLRTFAHLTNLDPGFDAERVVAASVSLEDARYRSTEQAVRLFDASLKGIALVPGVQRAGVSLGLPYQRLLNLGFRRVDGPDGTRGMTSAAYVAGDFFAAMGIPVRAGRLFDARDTSTSAGVAVVNDAFAATYFSGAGALGRRIAFAGREREIVGIVGNVQVRPGWGDHGPLAAMPLAYIPVTQVSDGMLRLVHGWFSPVFVVRASASLEQIGSGLRRALDEVDPLLPFARVQPMTDVRAASVARPRFLMALVLGLASAAILLAAVGIHGLIATSVAERTREMGIRLALGASAAAAVRALVVPAMALTFVGLAIGLGASVAAGRLVRHFVWGVSPTDPATFGAVALLFLTVAAAASLAPAMRLLRLDPAKTLRRP